jgi:hypothetical protein
MFTVFQSSYFRHQSQEDMSAQDSNRVGSQDSRNPAMSVLFTQISLQDSRLIFGEEQGPSREVVLLSKILTSENHWN